MLLKISIAFGILVVFLVFCFTALALYGCFVFGWIKACDIIGRCQLRLRRWRYEKEKKQRLYNNRVRFLAGTSHQIYLDLKNEAVYPDNPAKARGEEVSLRNFLDLAIADWRQRRQALHLIHEIQACNNGPGLYKIKAETYLDLEDYLNRKMVYLAIPHGEGQNRTWHCFRPAEELAMVRIPQTTGRLV